jgi:hypothetical protein
VDVLYSRVKRHIRECIKDCLQEENIDYEILRKTKTDSVALHEQTVLHEIKARLLKLLDRTLPFYGEMERTTSVEVQVGRIHFSLLVFLLCFFFFFSFPYFLVP